MGDQQPTHVGSSHLHGARRLCLPAALCSADGGSCHFHCTVLAALCGADVCLGLFLLINGFYLPIYAQLGLVVGMTNQITWKIMSTSLRLVDMIFLGLTIHYICLLTIWHLYNNTLSWVERSRLNWVMIDDVVLDEPHELWPLYDLQYWLLIDYNIGCQECS